MNGDAEKIEWEILEESETETDEKKILDPKKNEQDTTDVFC